VSQPFDVRVTPQLGYVGHASEPNAETHTKGHTDGTVYQVAVNRGNNREAVW